MKKTIAASVLGAVAGAALLAQTVLGAGATHVVQPGESLWKIAGTYGTTIAQLRDMNGMTGDMLLAGQSIRVPGPSVHVVGSGDTMWKISRTYGVSLDALLKANPQLKDPSNIWTGLHIQLPGTTAATPVASGKAAGTSAPAPARPAQYAEGVFPVAKGKYEPYYNTFSALRTWSPSGQVIRKHEGEDIMAPKGTPVYNAIAGTVVNYGWNQLGGWRLTVRVDAATTFYYAHLDRYAPGIGIGTKLAAGQLIGYVGSTGYGPEGTEDQFAPHLHFGIYKTDRSPWEPIDPQQYLRWWEHNNLKP